MFADYSAPYRVLRSEWGYDRMNNVWKKRFFECIKSVYEEKFEISEETIEGREALNIIFDLGDDSTPYEGTVTVDENEEDDTAAVNLLMVFRDGIPEEKSVDAVKMVSYFNSAITIGFFGIFEDTGCVYFNCTFNVIAKDDAAYYESAVKVLNETAKTAFAAVEEADEYLERFISGEATLDELIAEDIAIIQEIEPEDND